MLPKLIRREAEGTSSSDVEGDRQGTESMDGSSCGLGFNGLLMKTNLIRFTPSGDHGRRFYSSGIGTS